MPLVDNFTLSVPPQKTPLIDPAGDDNGQERRNGAFGARVARLFSRVWWKFFSGIVDELRALWEEADSLQAQIDALAPGTTASYIQDLGVLSGGTTNITSPVATPNEGDLLTVFWTQSTTGGEQITWDAIFQDVTANDNDIRKNRKSTVSFKAKSDNLWYPVALLMGRL